MKAFSRLFSSKSLPSTTFTRFFHQKSHKPTMSKLITVFGATGNQGGSVVRSIQADPVLSKEFKIRAITRDVNKPAAKALAATGVEVVSGDMSSKDTISPAIKGSHTVFLVTNFWESMSANTEVAQGKAVADAAKEAGVQHLVFSSLLNITQITQGRLSHISHFDGKADIETYIREIGVPATFVLPGMFMSGFETTIRKDQDGESYTLSLPLGGDSAQIPLVDPTSEMGRFTVGAVKNFPASQGKQLLVAEKYYTPNELVRQFSEVLGKPAKFQQIPAEVFKGFLPPAAAEELTENMLLMDDAGYYNGKSLDESRTCIEGAPKTWKEFVAENRAKWL